MSNSKENDNGRYFEYLTSRELEDTFKLKLTERAKAEQIRDKEKQIDPKTHDEMLIATKKIVTWLEGEFNPDENSILDRWPDKNAKVFSHEDISIQDSQDSNKKIHFSLKHNHTAVFHGRIVACKDWTGIDQRSPLVKKYENEKQKLISDLQTVIPIGTQFACRGIYQKYQDTWSNFIYELHESAKTFLTSACITPENTKNLFKTILGSGSDQYRVLKKGRKVIVQDLRCLTSPDSVVIKNVQNISARDERSKYVWHLVFEFDNDIKIDARNKQDSRIMKSTPQLKSDWQVVDWGESGIVENFFT